MKSVDHARRSVLASAAFVLAIPRMARSSPTPVEVWKSPTCGCCKGWITHLESDGFTVTVHDNGNTDARAKLRMPARYGSCHTAAIGGYAVEGHVPAREIHRLLMERPKAIGLAAPGMPLGAPGMEAYGRRRTPYDVRLVLNDGTTQVYQHYA